MTNEMSLKTNEKTKSIKDSNETVENKNNLTCNSEKLFESLNLKRNNLSCNQSSNFCKEILENDELLNRDNLLSASNENIKRDINKENLNDKTDKNSSQVLRSRSSMSRSQSPVHNPESEKRMMVNDKCSSSQNKNFQHSNFNDTAQENKSIISLDQNNLPKKRKGRWSKSKVPDSNITDIKSENISEKSNNSDSKVLDSFNDIKNDLEHVNTESINNSNTVKKRRGRPPKLNSSSSNDISAGDKNSVNKDEFENSTKNANKEDSIVSDKSYLATESSTNDEVQQLPEQKRRRGRPSKVNSLSSNDISACDENSVNKDELVNLTKNTNEEDSILSDKNYLVTEDFTNDEVQKLPETKRRRGRPPKSKASCLNVNVSTCASTNDSSFETSMISDRSLIGIENSINENEQDLSTLTRTRGRSLRSRTSDQSFCINYIKEESLQSSSLYHSDIETNTLISTTSQDRTNSQRRIRSNIRNSTRTFISKPTKRVNKRKQDNESLISSSIKLEENDLIDSDRTNKRKKLKMSEDCDANLENLEEKNNPDLSKNLEDSRLSKVNEDNTDKSREVNFSSSDVDTDIESKKSRKYSVRKRKTRRRGRPKRGREIVRTDTDYVPHHSHNSKLSRPAKTKKVNRVERSVQKMVTCGKCQIEVSETQWAHHNLISHNDLGWIEGSEKPNYDEDEKLLKKVLFNAIKRRRGSLICETCNEVKRSVLGYLSHVMFCGKNENEIQALMVTCDVCKAVIKPSSLEYHERAHKMQIEEQEKMIPLNVENEETGLKNKRKAAEKATVKISEFNALEKENIQDKKLKLNINDVKKIIKKPQFRKRIAGILIKKWRQALDNNQNAVCSQVGCEFSCKSIDEIKEHYSNCNFTPQENFVCKICRFQSSSEKDILNHAVKNHSTDGDDFNISLCDEEDSSCSENSEGGDVENDNSKPKTSSRSLSLKENDENLEKMFKFIFKDGICHIKHHKIFFNAFQWTLEFEEENYSFNLFEEYTPNDFKLLDKKQAKTYMPELEESMSVKHNMNNSNNLNTPETKWKKWMRFEGLCLQGHPTFFTSGPIWAMAWLPIPTLLAFHENISEYIAVSTHPTMESEYSVGKAYSGKNIIQIWRLGNLNHKNNELEKPELAYAITHEGGTVWCLEWCPSGCYQHEDLPGFVKENNHLKRMGLLAAACSDGCIRIYSLTFPENLPDITNIHSTANQSENTENTYPIYNTEPSLVLITNLHMYDNQQQNVQVTKLSWCKENGHSVIAAGYSNGYVALWDISTKSPMLKVKREKTTILMPYRHFLAHNHGVTMAYLIPQDNKRFLVTASLDRYFKLWDLEDISNPKNTFKKSFITDGSWLTNWCCAVTSADDALNLNHNYVQCLPLREYTYKYYNVLPMNSASYTISTSDFGNSIASGTLAGEVLAIFPHQMLYIRNMEKILLKKRTYSLISFLKTVDFEGQAQNENVQKNKQSKKNKNNDNTEYSFMPKTYNDSKDRFGIEFCDNKSSKRQLLVKKSGKKTLTCEEMREVPIEQYPFMSVNRVSWNPNAWGFLWLAVGYQNGFVRLIPFKSMESSTEWNNLLTTHIDKIRSKASEHSLVATDEN